jgi:hypothetical protein
MSVRANDASGEGLLYLKGQLIAAKLPEFLNPGDKLLAKIDNINKQIIFQLLDVQGKQTDSVKAPISDLTRKLQAFISEQTKLNFQLNDPLKVDRPLENVVINNLPLAKVLDFLAPNPQANESQRTVDLISKLIDGTLSKDLQNVSKEIRQFIQTAVPSAFERFASILKVELTNIQNQPVSSSSLKLIENLINLSKEEIATNKQFTPSQKVILNTLVQDLRQASAEPKNLEQHLNNTLNQLQLSLTTTTDKHGQFSAKEISDLGQLANRFEQLANSVDFLNKLNPIMQALGEPALILFPFLFHGMLNHSQITVDSNARGKNKHTEEGDSKSSNKKQFQHIQVTLPLPTIGDVAVDIAHREQEIFVRFTVEDSEIGSFLLEQLEYLGTVLREQGFEKAELVANVGAISSKPPQWALTVQASRSIVV